MIFIFSKKYFGLLYSPLKESFFLYNTYHWFLPWILYCGVVQLLSHVRLFVTPWAAACQASLSFTISQSLLKLMPIESMMPSNHLILCQH